MKKIVMGLMVVSSLGIGQNMQSISGPNVVSRNFVRLHNENISFQAFRDKLNRLSPKQLLAKLNRLVKSSINVDKEMLKFNHNMIDQLFFVNNLYVNFLDDYSRYIYALMADRLIDSVQGKTAIFTTTKEELISLRNGLGRVNVGETDPIPTEESQLNEHHDYSQYEGQPL